MNITILGTGMVGRTVAGRLVELGHAVTLGTRDPEATRARRDTDAYGSPEAGLWLERHPGVALKAFPEAPEGADLLVNATNGGATLEVLGSIGSERLGTSVLLDIANPLDFSAGMPPTLFVKDTDSLAEQVQRTFPRLRVVKSLNTLTAELMVRPDRLAEGTSVFVSGDDTAAKQVVTALLTELGHTDVIDLGDLSTARGTEMLLPLWLRLWGALGTPMFNLKVVR